MSFPTTTSSLTDKHTNKYTDGLWGALLAPLVANIFMEEIEEMAIETTPVPPNT
jgi:hypothetical protein